MPILSQHVTHLLPAYVARELDPRRRMRVAKHLSNCAECRAALIRESNLARDLKATMPHIGEPRPGQLARLWPAIRAEIARAPRRSGTLPFASLMPSAGLLMAMLLMGAFGLSALFGNPAHASAAPNPFVPSDIQATNTPVRTDSPDDRVIALAEPRASQTANAFNVPMASPAPLPARRDTSHLH
jgi:anti-sigma factor RsiW